MNLDLEIWKILLESHIKIDDIIVLLEDAPYENLIQNWNKFHDDVEEEDNEINQQISYDLSEYIEEIKKFENDFHNFRNKLKEYGKEILVCNLNEIDPFEFVSEYFYKEFHPIANEITEAEMKIENKIFDSFDNFENEEEPAKQTKKNNNYHLGDTDIYCPVALKRNGVLWKGQENLSSFLANKIYFLSSKNALEDFLRNSQEFFLPLMKPFEKIPPARICIVGVPGSGKSTMAKTIAKEYGLAYIDYFSKIDDFMQQLGFNMISWEEDNSDLKNNQYSEKSNEDGETSREDIISSEDENTFEDLETDHQEILSNDPESLTDKNPFVFDKNTTESIARNYRKHGGNLTEIIIRESFLKYFKPPFHECGVIFDSFPNCTEDVELMLKEYSVPEIIIELQCNLKLSLERLLPVLLDAWKVKENQKKLKEQEKFNKEMELYNKRKEKWINEKLKEIKENDRKKKEEIDEFENDISIATLKNSFQDSSNLIDNLDPLDELEQLYYEKNLKPKLFSNWETENSARKRLIKRIKESFQNYQKNLKKIRERIKKESSSISWIEINSQQSIEKLFCLFLKILNPYLHRNASFFEHTYLITRTIAEKLIECGYYFLSSFNRFCPVQMFNKKVPLQIFSSPDEIFPLIHRQYIYFLHGKNSLELFRNDPLKYLNQDSCSPLIFVQISIIGPPNCGKSTLAQQFATTYGFKIITRGESLRDILEKSENSLINEQQLAQATVISSLDSESSLGIIFDGYPESQLEVEELALLSIKPMIVFDLQADFDFCQKCFTIDEIKNLEFFKNRYENWRNGEKEFRNWLTSYSANIVKVDAKKCKLDIWIAANEEFCSRITAIKKYFREADYDKVHHLEHLCITPYEFKNRISSYQTFCPVCIQRDQFLSSQSLERQGLFQFRAHFYWICSKHIDSFIKNPIDNLMKKMPRDYPKILQNTIDIDNVCRTKKLQLSEFCIITYVDNLPYRRIIPGKQEFGIVYKKRLYLFCSLNCRNKFMEHCSKYSEVEIYFPKILSLQMKNLPNLGFLEQNVASLIVKCIRYVGAIRPKLPGLSASASAAIYFGVYLKMQNLKSDKNQVDIYKNILKRMNERREYFQNVLQKLKKMDNPYLNRKLEKREICRKEDENLDKTIEKISKLSRHSVSVKFKRTSPTQVFRNQDDNSTNST